MLIGESRWRDNSNTASRQVDTLTLLQQPTPLYLGELSWRLGLGLCALNFILLALPLSAVNPRRGRSYQFALALLVFVVYYNMVNIGQNWIAHGRFGLLAWMLGLHGLASSLTLLWLWARHQQWSWRDLWPVASRKVNP
mgnify:FL=1